MSKHTSTGDKERKRIQKHNRFLDLIRRHPGISRQAIAETLRISTFNISHLTRELMGKNLVLEKGENPEDKKEHFGRPSIPLHLNGDFEYFAGIDLEATCWRLVILDFAGKLIFEKELPFKEQNQRQGYEKQLKQNLESAIQDFGEKKWAKVTSLCIGVPGSLDREKGRVIQLEMLPNFTDISLVPLMQKVISQPVVMVDNISNLAIYEQWIKPELTQKVVLHFAIRSGIKLVLMQAGQLFQGVHHYAGEIGFLKSNFADSQSETLHDQLSVLSLKQKRKDLPESFWQGDEQSVQRHLQSAKEKDFWLSFGEILCNTLQGLTYLLDPDEIILHIPKFMRHPELVDPWLDLYTTAAQSRSFAPPPLQISQQPAHGAAIGAGLRAIADRYPID